MRAGQGRRVCSDRIHKLWRVGDRVRVDRFGLVRKDAWGADESHVIRGRGRYLVVAEVFNLTDDLHEVSK